MGLPDRTKRSNSDRAGWRDEEALQPAFKTNVGAVWFLVLVFFALVLPKIITSTELISRRHSYEMLPEKLGGYSFMTDEVFNKKEELDILFIGSSIIWNGVDTPQVQQALSDHLGRQARTVTFGYSFNSFDISYSLLRDLLERRRVRLVVLSIPRLTYPEGPSATAFKFLRYDENPEIVAGLPLEGKISLYACSVLRSPRDLLTIARPNSPVESPYADTFGAFKREEGVGANPLTFERFAPQAPRLPATDLIYSDSTKDLFKFSNTRIPAHQDYYLERVVELLRENGVPFAILNVPQYSERRHDKVIELENWQERFGADIPLMGISPTTLFAGLSDKEVEKLHSDHEHFNLNGCEFYTDAILPAILEVYSNHAKKSF
ncbi:MAG TPA: hypothetical protein VFZ23_16650 [Pyrinomonadaceae bacterium]